MKLLTVVTDSPGVVVNVFFLLTFPLVAASAYVVLRALGFARPVVAACAVVYALLPFHFLRGEGHLFLSAYYAVPVGAWLVLGVMGRVPLALRRAGEHGVRAWLTRATLITAGACVLAGSSDVYFAVLIAAVALAAGVVRALVDRRLKAARPAVIVAAAVLATLTAVEAPTIVWHMRHGGNATVTQRLPWESEAFGLKFANLVLPQPGHRAQPLADARGALLRADPASRRGAHPGARAAADPRARHRRWRGGGERRRARRAQRPRPASCVTAASPPAQRS